LAPKQLEVLDESDQHVGHAGHQGGGRHFAVIISAECFGGATRVEAHRQIYALFEDMIPEQIHALRIKII
jgi:BolA protein